jgi:hypothetical protein
MPRAGYVTLGTFSRLAQHDWEPLYFCINYDEYASGASGCAYSIMSLGNAKAIGVWNFCYSEDVGASQHNHAEDGDFVTVYPAVWSVSPSSAQITVRPDNSPDNFDFRNHDFNGWIETTIF